MTCYNRRTDNFRDLDQRSTTIWTFSASCYLVALSGIGPESPHYQYGALPLSYRALKLPPDTDDGVLFITMEVLTAVIVNIVTAEKRQLHVASEVESCQPW
jgi:hypothetical protein